MPISLTCEKCGKEFSVKQSRVARRKVRYCSQACYDAVRVTRSVVTCGHCGKEFVTDGHRHDASTSGLQFCDQDCYGRWRSGKYFGHLGAVPSDQLITEYNDGMSLRELSERYGLSTTTISAHIKKGRKSGIVTRKRTTTDMDRNRPNAPGVKGAANARYIHIPTDEVISAYARGISTRAIGRLHGVSAKKVSDSLRAAGVALRGSGYSEVVSICADGHRAESSFERAVDDWLSAHGLEHTPHPILPWAKWPSLPRADFLVGDTYIEIWGLMGIAQYEQKRLEKLANYQRYALDLIELYPEHIHTGDYSLLDRLLKS